MSVSHEVKRRSPQFSLAKKVGYGLGKTLFQGGKNFAAIPLPPFTQAISIYPKLFGTLLKALAKGGQILL